MQPVFRSLAAALALSLVTVSAYHLDRLSAAKSGSTITFADQRRFDQGRPGTGRGGTSEQHGETSATSVQHSTGDGQQTNRGQATGVSVQKQTGLGGATQTTNNQGVIDALQQANGSGGSGGTQQTSNNQVNINSSQLQQNVNGTLINVQEGHQGVVIINTSDQSGAIVKQEVVNDRPLVKSGPDSANCRYTCRHPHQNTLYCCDDGTNRVAEWDIHGGACPPVRGLCTRNDLFTPCAHDGQCAKSDKCCFDACAERHICKTPIPA